MATKLYPPIVEGTIPAFCLNYDASKTYLRSTVLTVPFTMNSAVSETLVKGFSLRLRTVSSGTYLFEPIFSDVYDLVKQEVTFTLTSLQCKKLMEGLYYKVLIAYCGRRVINDAGDPVGLDIGYYSTVGVIKCTSHPDVSIKGMALENINSFNNEFLGLYDISKCNDLTEKVYSYHFTIWNDKKEVCFTSGELLHKTIYDVEYTSSFDRISVNDFLTDDKIYTIQYLVTTLNGLIVGSPKYKITNAYLVSTNAPVTILPEANHELGYVDVKFKGELNEQNSYYLVINPEAFNDLGTNNDYGAVITPDGNGDFIYNYVRRIVSGQKDMGGYCSNYALYRKYPKNRVDLDNPPYFYVLMANVPSGLIRYDNVYYSQSFYYTTLVYYLEGSISLEDYEAALRKEDCYVKVLDGSKFVKKIPFSAVNNNSVNLNNYLVVNLKEVEKNYYGSYLLSRASDEDNYSTWYNLRRFRWDNDFPSNYHFKDYTVEHGRKYKYALLQYNLWGLYSARMTSEEYMANFEDTYIWDGERAIRLQYNPEVSSFKTTILELKTDTIGGRFPFITRNGYTYYKEFPVGGLLAAEIDDLLYFIDPEFGETHRHATPDAEYDVDGKVIQPRNAYRNYRFFEDENIALEKDFKIRVLEWLNDGKPKMFKSPYEGNYIVRLMNNSLTPVNELGRLLHSFSSTAYEIADYNYDNLIAFGFLKTNSPSDYTGAWKGFYLGDYDTTEDIILDMEGGVNSFTIQDMMPGDMIYLTIVGEEEELPIMIGVTGSYSYADLDTKVTKIRIPLREDGTKIIGVVNCYYETIRITAFDAIIGMLLKTIHSQQYVGVSPWADNIRNMDLQTMNNLNLFSFSLNDAEYNAIYDYNLRDYIDTFITEPYDELLKKRVTLINYSVQDEDGDTTNFQHLITSFDPGEILDRINLTLNKGEVYKTLLVNIEMLRFRLREIIPVYAFEKKTNTNDVYGAYSNKITKKSLRLVYREVKPLYDKMFFNKPEDWTTKTYYIKSGTSYVLDTGSSYNASLTYYKATPVVNEENFMNFFIKVNGAYTHTGIYKPNVTYYEEYYEPNDLVLMVSASPYKYPHPIEHLLRIELLDPFCIFLVMSKRPSDGMWVPINEISDLNISSCYYDPYYKTWQKSDYDPTVHINYHYTPVIRLSRDTNGALLLTSGPSAHNAHMIYEKNILNQEEIAENKQTIWKNKSQEEIQQILYKNYNLQPAAEEELFDSIFYDYELFIDENNNIYYGNNSEEANNYSYSGETNSLDHDLSLYDRNEDIVLTYPKGIGRITFENMPGETIYLTFLNHDEDEPTKIIVNGNGSYSYDNFSKKIAKIRIPTHTDGTSFLGIIRQVKDGPFINYPVVESIYNDDVPNHNQDYHHMGFFSKNNLIKLKNPKFDLFEKDENNNFYVIGRVPSSRDIEYDHVYYIKEYDVNLDLLVEKEITYDNLKQTIYSISIGNGVVAEISFLLRVLDYYTEIFDQDVIDKKAKYLAAKNFYATLMETYRTISNANAERLKYYALKELYYRLLYGNAVAIEDKDATGIINLLKNEKEKMNLNLMKLYDLEMLHSGLDQSLIDELVEFKENTRNNTASRYNIDYAKFFDITDTDGTIVTTVKDMGDPNCYILSNIRLGTDGQIIADVAQGTSYYNSGYYSNGQNTNDLKFLYEFKDSNSVDTYMYLVNKDQCYNLIYGQNSNVLKTNLIVGVELPLTAGLSTHITMVNKNDFVYTDAGSPVKEYTPNDTEKIVSSLMVLTDEEFASVKLDPYFISGILSQKADLKKIINNITYYLLNEETEIRVITLTDELFKGVKLKYDAIDYEATLLRNSINDFSSLYNDGVRNYIKAYNDLLQELNNYNTQIYKSWVAYIIEKYATTRAKWDQLYKIFLYNIATLDEHMTDFEQSARSAAESCSRLYDYAASYLDEVQVYDRMVGEIILNKDESGLDEFLLLLIAVKKGQLLMCLMAMYDAGYNMKTAITQFISTYENVLTNTDFNNIKSNLILLFNTNASKYEEIYSQIVDGTNSNGINGNIKSVYYYLTGTGLSSNNYLNILTTFQYFKDQFIDLNARELNNIISGSPIDITNFSQLTIYYDDMNYLLRLFYGRQSGNSYITRNSKITLTGTNSHFKGFKELNNNNLPSGFVVLSSNDNPYNNFAELIREMSYDNKVEFTANKNILTFHYRVGLVTYKYTLDPVTNDIPYFIFNPYKENGGNLFKVTDGNESKYFKTYYNSLTILQKAAVDSLYIQLSTLGEEMMRKISFSDANLKKLLNSWGLEQKDGVYKYTQNSFIKTCIGKKKELVSKYLIPFLKLIFGAGSYINNKPSHGLDKIAIKLGNNTINVPYSDWHILLDRQLASQGSTNFYNYFAPLLAIDVDNLKTNSNIEEETVAFASAETSFRNIYPTRTFLKAESSWLPSFDIDNEVFHICTRVSGNELEEYEDGVYYKYLTILKEDQINDLLKLLEDAEALENIYYKQLENYKAKYDEYSDLYELNQGLYMSYYGTEAYDYYNKVNGLNNYSGLNALTDELKIDLLNQYRDNVKQAWYEFLIYLDAKYSAEKEAGMYR